MNYLQAVLPCGPGDLRGLDIWLPVHGCHQCSARRLPTRGHGFAFPPYSWERSGEPPGSSSHTAPANDPTPTQDTRRQQPFPTVSQLEETFLSILPRFHAPSERVQAHSILQYTSLITYYSTGWKIKFPPSHPSLPLLAGLETDNSRCFPSRMTLLVLNSFWTGSINNTPALNRFSPWGYRYFRFSCGVHRHSHRPGYMGCQ